MEGERRRNGNGTSAEDAIQLNLLVVCLVVKVQPAFVES